MKEGSGRNQSIDDSQIAIYDQIMVWHLVCAAWPISQSHVAVRGRRKLSKYVPNDAIEKPHKEETKMQHALGCGRCI